MTAKRLDTALLVASLLALVGLLLWQYAAR